MTEPLEDVPVEVPVDAPAEAPVEVSDEEAAKSRRGRPRSQETLERDAKVVEVLRERGPLSREQLGEALGVPSNLVYLSLWRLKHDGQVAQHAEGAIRHAWALVGE